MRKEYLIRTAIHGRKFNEDIMKVDFDENIKNGFRQLVNDFMADLFEMADFDPREHLSQ